MKRILDFIRKSLLGGLPTYIVGGAVRDFLMGKSPKDIDILVETSPEELRKLGGQPISTISAFPIFLFNIKGIGNVEVALPRKERKQGYGYKGFETITGPEVTVIEDLVRRDFTVNAMAIRVSDGALIDPYDGINDLKEGTLRHVSSAFIEDPLRVFRTYRFCGKGFTLSQETRDFIKSHSWEEDFKNLPTERVWGEISKALETLHPHRFFEEWVKTRVGEQFFPELFKMKEVPVGKAERHPEGDCLQHSLIVLEKVARKTTDPVVRLAAFLHDIGKILTPKEKWPSHHGHDILGEKIIKRCLTRLKAPKKIMETCSTVAALHMKAARWTELRPSTKLEIAERAIKGEAQKALPMVVEADHGIKIKNFCEIASVSQLSATQVGIPVEWIENATPENIKQRVLHERIKLVNRGE